jgi:hypothetical protein
MRERIRILRITKIETGKILFYAHLEPAFAAEINARIDSDLFAFRPGFSFRGRQSNRERTVRIPNHDGTDGTIMLQGIRQVGVICRGKLNRLFDTAGI